MFGVEKVLLNNIGITHLYITLSFIDPTKGISFQKVYCTVWYFRLAHFKICLLSVINGISAKKHKCVGKTNKNLNLNRFVMLTTDFQHNT